MTAQGRERSPPGVREYATPGSEMQPLRGKEQRIMRFLPRRGCITKPGVAYSRTPGGLRCNSFGVRLARVAPTQGALAALATLGCEVQRLRRKENRH